MFFKSIKLAAAMVIGLSTVPASAATFVYDLLDHPNVGMPNFEYGLRLDDAGPRFFSFENGASATLTYDDVLKKVRIIGTMVESLGGGAFGAVFNVKYTINNVTNIGALGSGLFQDFSGTGVGNINDGGATSIALGAKANGAGKYFVFNADGKDIPGDNSTLVGRGWVDTNPNSTGANDFKFTAVDNPGGGGGVVPLPAAGWMLLSGLAGLGAIARRRRG